MTEPTIGAYLDPDGTDGLGINGFVVVAPAGGYTVTYALDESSGDTMEAGEATIYMIYTRIE